MQLPLNVSQGDLAPFLDFALSVRYKISAEISTFTVAIESRFK